MTPEQMKKSAAQAAMQFITPDSIIGVGTGSTVKYFIDELAVNKHLIKGVVSSSSASTEQLKSHAIPIYDCNEVSSLDLYVDGADEINSHKQMIKGGGGALTREKIIAAMAKQFVCIVDESKWVDTLGQFPLPIEVIPMARSFVGREIVKLKGDPAYRSGVVTDNGNIIIDVHHLSISTPLALEEKINAIPGVVTVGLFAHRAADIVITGTKKGAQITQG